MRWLALTGGKEFRVEDDGGIRLNGRMHTATLSRMPAGYQRLVVDGKVFNVFCRKTGENIFDIWIKHGIITVELQDLRRQLLQVSKKTSGSVVVKAPMPGLIATIEVSPGDFVEKGAGLLILEAMKMENEIRSPVSGTVKSVDVKSRMTVDKGQKMLVIEPGIDHDR